MVLLFAMLVVGVAVTNAPNCRSKRLVWRYEGLIFEKLSTVHLVTIQEDSGLVSSFQLTFIVS